MKVLKNEYRNITLSEYDLSSFLRKLRRDGLEVREVHERYENLVQFAEEFLIILLKKYEIVTEEMIDIYKKSLRIADTKSGRNVILRGENFGIGDHYPNENTGGLLYYSKDINTTVSIYLSFDFSWDKIQKDSGGNNKISFLLPPVRDDWNIKLEDIKDEKDKEVLKNLLIEISRCNYITTNYLSHLCRNNNTYTFLRNHIKSPITWNKLLKFDKNLFEEYLRLYGYSKKDVFVNEFFSSTTETDSIKKFEKEPRVILNKLRETLEK